MRGLRIFFPMASPQAPVGYAELGLGASCADWERLPAANFDVHTAADAWASLRGGELWPAGEPEGALRWRPSFLGPPGEVDAGRSRGKSAHLALVLAAAAFRAGAMGPAGQDGLGVWASGELDRDGRLMPVDGLPHKLRVFLEHWSCHPGQAVFLAPAANRATVDLAQLGLHQPVREVLFDRRHPLPAVEPGCPLVLWVNRADVGALLERILRGKGWASPPGRRVGRLLGLVGVCLLVGLLTTLGLLPGLPGRAEPHSPPPELGGARLAIVHEHGWRFEAARVASALKGARIEDGWVVWEQPLSDYAPPDGGPCGPGHHLPSRVRLRYALGERDFWAGALGEDPEVLAVVRPPWGIGHLVLVSGEYYHEQAYYRRAVFEPRTSLLAVAMATQSGELLRQGLLLGGSRNPSQMFLDGRWSFFHGMPLPILLAYQAMGCCGVDNACDDQHTHNLRCPQASADATGPMERSFRLHAVNPRGAYLGLWVGGADTGNRSAIWLDGRERSRCAGPFHLPAFLVNEVPTEVRLWSERAWSTSRVELSAAILAESLSFSQARQQPEHGLDDDPAPTLARIEPGLTGPPEVLLWDDFDAPELDPGWQTLGDTGLAGRRLRLVRAGGQYGTASRELPAPADAAWRFELTAALATESSILVACLVDRTWPRRTCLTLNNCTENGKQAGAHLLCEVYSDGFGLPNGHELAEHGFKPRAGEPHRLALERARDGRLVFRVDGAVRGESDAGCAVTRFDWIELFGYQDSQPGHGGFVDDLIVYRQLHEPLRDRVDGGR